MLIEQPLHHTRSLHIDKLLFEEQNKTVIQRTEPFKFQLFRICKSGTRNDISGLFAFVEDHLSTPRKQSHSLA